VDCSTRRKGGTRQSRVVPLVRVPLDLRAGRGGPADRGAAHRAGPAIVLAMVLVGLSRCQVLGLRLADIQIADRRLPAVEGKGGHHRVVPAANRFFGAPGDYLHDERPDSVGTDRIFVVLKGPRRGRPPSAEGLDAILDGAPGVSTAPATNCGIPA